MPLFPNLNIRTKLALGICAIVIFIALLLTFTITHISSRALIEESKKRGLVLTENLAVRAEQGLLVEDLLQLKNLVDELTRLDDVAYAFVQNRQGEIPAHSFLDGFPRQLGPLHRERPGDGVILVDTSDSLIYDFAVPILIDGQPFGSARVGLAHSGIDQVVSRLLRAVAALSFAALLVALAVGTLFADQLSRRLKALRAHAAALARGKTDSAPAGPHRGDEIEDLSATFQVMAESLQAHLRELKATEEILTRQQHLLSTILEATPDWVCLLDNNLQYLKINKAAADFIGLAEADILGRSIDSVAALHQHAALLAEEGRAVLEQGRSRQREIAVQHNDRSYWLDLLAVPVMAGGESLGVLLSARDITGIKRYQEQLIQAQKMESVGQLAGGVAHEINTPLGVILGYAQLLQEDPGEPEQLIRDLQIIEKQTKTCRKIVSDLLGFSRQLQNPKQDICLNNTIMEAAALVRHTFSREGIKIILDLDDRLPITHADPDKLKQVWVNLFNNARDAMPNGGMITVQVRLDGLRQAVVIRVADTGSGINEQDLSKIFDPFYSTKPVGKGTGLGLSVSFGIIKEHGGRIQAFSPPPPEFQQIIPQQSQANDQQNQGTLFTVELPFDDGSPSLPNRGFL